MLNLDEREVIIKLLSKFDLLRKTAPVAYSTVKALPHAYMHSIAYPSARWVNVLMLWYLAIFCLMTLCGRANWLKMWKLDGGQVHS